MTATIGMPSFQAEMDNSGAALLTATYGGAAPQKMKIPMGSIVHVLAGERMLNNGKIRISYGDHDRIDVLIEDFADLYDMATRFLNWKAAS